MSMNGSFFLIKHQSINQSINQSISQSIRTLLIQVDKPQRDRVNGYISKMK